MSLMVQVSTVPGARHFPVNSTLTGGRVQQTTPLVQP